MLIDDYDSSIQPEPMPDSFTEQAGLGNEGDSSFVPDNHETGYNYSYDNSKVGTPNDIWHRSDDGLDYTSSTNLFEDGGTETAGGVGYIDGNIHDTAFISNKFGEGGTETAGGMGYRHEEEVDFSQYKVDTVNDDGTDHTFHPTFQHTQSEINRHISDAKSEISRAESTIRYHESIAASKARMGEPHGNENYQISQARHRLEEAQRELYKWEHTKPEK